MAGYLDVFETAARYLLRIADALEEIERQLKSERIADEIDSLKDEVANLRHETNDDIGGELKRLTDAVDRIGT